MSEYVVGGAALVHTADRIRAKTGSAAKLTWDDAKGCGDAVDAIDKKMEELTTLRAQLAERIADIQYHIASEDRNGGIEVREIETRPVLKLSENVLLQRSLIGVIACHSLDKAKR